jgi:hypothetical protein
VASRITDCVQGYTVLASSFLESWSALASKSASKIDAGNYTAASAVEDATAGTMLAAQTGWAGTALWWECLAGVGGFEGEATTNRSQKFKVEKGADEEAKLEPLRSFMTGPGLEELPAGAVTIHPEVLKPGEDEFSLGADGIVCRGATYVAEVNVTVGKKPKPRWVWITVT